MSDRLYNISEAAELVGKVTNRKLIRKLIRIHRIRTIKHRSGTFLDEAGVSVLKAAVKEWDNRPMKYRRTEDYMEQMKKAKVL